MPQSEQFYIVNKDYLFDFPICKGSCKKITVFLVARPPRPYPPPLELSGHKFFSQIFLELKKTVFFLSGQALPPTPRS